MSVELNEPVVRLFDRSGALARTVRVDIPDAVGTSIAGVAISAAGELIVSGGSENSSGAAAQFMAWLDGSGKVRQVVRTSPWVAYQLCAADDGTVWALGRQLPTEAERREPDHDVLRHYAADGRLLGSMLPRSGFQGRLHPSLRSFVFAWGDRIGIYSTGGAEWVEVDPAGRILGRWKTLDNGTTGFKTWVAALSPAGTVYATVSSPGAGGIPKQRTIRLDRSTGSWVDVPASKWLGEGATTAPTVLGVDGTDLVISPKMPLLLWVAE